MILTSKTIFAEEALYEAFALVTHIWRQEAEKPDTSDWPAEAGALVRSLCVCLDLGLWNDRLSSVTREDCASLVGQIRHVALTQDEVAQSPENIARAVAHFAVFLRDRMEITPETAPQLPQVALHIAMAMLSLVKANQLIETLFDLTHDDALKRRILAWCPSDDDALSTIRFEHANLNADLAFVRDQIGRHAALWATCFASELDDDGLATLHLCTHTPDDLAPIDRLKAWFATATRFSYTAQLEIVERMPDAAQTAWLTRLLGEPEYASFDAPELALRRLRSLARIEQALGALILHDFAAFDAVAHQNIDAGVLGAWHVLRALASQMQNLPWADTLLRQTVSLPEPIRFWPQLQPLYFALRAEACITQNAPELALTALQDALAADLCDEQICAAFAHAHMKLNHFGEAQQWLTRAEEYGATAHTQAMRQALARQALKAAKHSMLPDASLLELAMDLGDGTTTADAALCCFDADLAQAQLVAQKLADNANALDLFITTLLKRTDIAHYDALCDIADALHDQTEAPLTRCKSEVLSALARLDNPDDAFARLAHALSRWSDKDKTRNTSVFWKAAERYIEIGTNFYAFDEMTRTLANDFAQPTAQSLMLFKLLLAQTPRPALMGVQQALVETLGRDETIACFTRLKQPIPNTGTPDDTETDSMPSALPDIVAAPEIWHIWARVGAQLHPISKLDTPSPRQIAQKLMMQSREKMPEPPKAEWVHTKQGKASDAFSR